MIFYQLFACLCNVAAIKIQNEAVVSTVNENIVSSVAGLETSVLIPGNIKGRTFVNVSREHYV